MSLLTKLLMRCCCTTPEEPDCACTWSEAGVEVLPESVTVTIDIDITFVSTGICVSGNCFGASNSANKSVKFVTHPPTTGTWDVPRTNNSCGLYVLVVDGEYTMNQYVGTSCSGAATPITAYTVWAFVSTTGPVSGLTHEVALYATRSDGNPINAGAIHHRYFATSHGVTSGVPCLTVGNTESACGGDITLKTQINRAVNLCCVTGGRGFKFLGSGGAGTLSVVVS
jgi:hypothetical protein